MIVLDASATVDWLLQTPAGRRIEQRIYARKDTLHTKGKDGQMGEQLTVIVSDKPVEGINVGADAQALSPEQVAAWEKKWSGDAAL